MMSNMSRQLFYLLFAASLVLALGATCPPKPGEPRPAVSLPTDQVWVGPVGSRWIAERSVRGQPVPGYPVSGLAVPVCLAMDGTVVVSPVTDSYECGGYFSLTEMIEPQLAELPHPPPTFRDIQKYAARSGARLWLWAWRPEDYEALSAANRQTRWLLPDNRPGETQAESGANPAHTSARRPPPPSPPVVAPRLPILPGIPVENLTTLAEWFESAGASPRKYLADDPLAGWPYATPPALAPSPYVYPLRAPRHGPLPNPALPLQDRLSLPDPVGRLVAFSTISIEGRQPGPKYQELYAMAMASNINPLARRNAILAIGGISDSRQMTLLLTCLKEKEPQMAEAAAYMTGLAKLTAGQNALLEVRRNRPELRDVTAWALARLNSADLLAELVQKLKKNTPSGLCPLSAGELMALGTMLKSPEIKDELSAAVLRPLSNLVSLHPDPTIRRAAVVALCNIDYLGASRELHLLLKQNLIASTELPAVVSKLTSFATSPRTHTGTLLLLDAWSSVSPTARNAIGLGLQFADAPAQEECTKFIRKESGFTFKTKENYQAAIMLMGRLPKTEMAVKALQEVPPEYRPAAAVLNAWNEPVPEDWPENVIRPLLPAEVARRRMARHSATQPALPHAISSTP